MKWPRDTSRDRGKQWRFFAIIPHLCEQCDAWFWFEFGLRRITFECEAGVLYGHRCMDCRYPLRAEGA